MSLLLSLVYLGAGASLIAGGQDSLRASRDRCVHARNLRLNGCLFLFLGLALVLKALDVGLMYFHP